MNIIEQIKAEIERQRKFIEGMFIEGDNNFYDGQDDAYNNILTFLSTLEKSNFKDFPTTDEEMAKFLAAHPKVEVPEKYKTPDWMFEKSEKPLGLEEEINRTYHDGSVTDTSDLDHNSYENIAHHFYELGCRRTAEKYDEIEYNRQRAEECVPNDLDEAANKFAVFYDQGTCDGIAQECFIAGAKWQAKRMKDEKEKE